MTQQQRGAGVGSTALAGDASITARQRTFTPSEVTAVLHASGVLPRGRSVLAIDAQPLGVGESMMSELWRLGLSYDTAFTPAPPRSIVVKLACPDDFRREIADRFGFYRREVDFYDHLATAVHMRSPRCYAAVIDEHSNEFALMLEDVSDHRRISQADGCGIDEARLVARSLADLHATWWGRTDELSMPVVAMDSENHIEDLVATFVRSWPTCRTLAGDRMPPEMIDVGERWASVGPQLARRLATPRTLCHGDFRVDNLRFVTGGEVIAFDWQLLTLANGVTDLAYFVSQSVRTEARRGRDRELLDLYLTCLAGRGVSYDAADAWEVYRTAVLAMSVFPVTLYGGFTDLPALGQRTTASMLDRAIAAIVELDATAVPAAR